MSQGISSFQKEPNQDNLAPKRAIWQPCPEFIWKLTYSVSKLVFSDLKRFQPKKTVQFLTELEYSMKILSSNIQVRNAPKVIDDQRVASVACEALRIVLHCLLIGILILPPHLEK